MGRQTSVIPDRSRRSLSDCARMSVKAVARMPGPAADELFNIAADGRTQWSLLDWQRVLDSLDSCDDSVNDWLAIRS